MRKVFIALFFLVMLISGAACMDNLSDFPEPVGYDGFLALGWQALQQGEYMDAFDFFQQAIAIDVARADGFLGAGVSSLYLEDYREQGDDFFQTAIHQDMGSSIVVQYTGEAQTQDTLWTVFRCVDSDLPQDSLDTWLPMTADSGEVWVGQKIFNYLTVNGLSTDLQFRFAPKEDNVIASVELHNIQSGVFYHADSTASGNVYFTAPLNILNVGEGIDYYTWVMVGQSLGYDYAILAGAGRAAGQITLDALAAWTMLQEIRGTEGDLLQATACALGLLRMAPDYLFGKGDAVRESLFKIDVVDVVASAAAYAFYNQKYIYSWFMCKQVGYGLDLDPLSESFLLELLEILTQMKS